MNTVIRKLSSGYEVEVRAVPPTAYLDVEMEFIRNHPPLAKPTIRAQSVAGHTEEIAASLDSPEYQAYQHQAELRDMELRAAKINFAYNYAVVQWRKVPEAESKAAGLQYDWTNDAPFSWVPDKSILDKTSNKRTLFIKYELIQTLDDDRAISSPFAVAPMTEEEVDAALAGFRSDAERKSTGRRSKKR